MAVFAHETQASHDGLTRIISELVALRQRLRATGAAAETLEANRLALVYRQQELSRALIAAHGGDAQRPT